MKEIIQKWNLKATLLHLGLDSEDIKHIISEVENQKKQSLTDYHNHIVEKIKNWFDSELENNKGDIKTYRNIHQDKEGIISLLQDTNPKE